MIEFKGLGNSEFNSLDDIAEVLERLVAELKSGKACGLIRDINGNVVLTYDFNKLAKE